MKIYKLNIDASQPTNQVVAMQQNSTGLLSVDVKRNDWPIRNLSCALYDGDAEISSCLSGESGAGYKLDVGDTAKAVKFTAKSEPIESINQYIASHGSGNRTVTTSLVKLVLPAGVYKQDEFMPLLEKINLNSSGIITNWFVHTNSRSNTNFSIIQFIPWHPTQKIWFYTGSGNPYIMLPEDELISASGEVSVCFTHVVKVDKPSSIVLSSYTYPAIGYYTDYSKETVIRPSMNAPCWAERDIVDPTPDPEPEPTPETPAEEPNE